MKNEKIKFSNITYYLYFLSGGHVQGWMHDNQAPGHPFEGVGEFEKVEDALEELGLGYFEEMEKGIVQRVTREALAARGTLVIPFECEDGYHGKVIVRREWDMERLGHDTEMSFPEMMLAGEKND